MYYSEQEAKKLIISACQRLVSEKLIARTWGNVSARISENRFIITPSGRSYDTLSKDELVTVDARDLSYDESKGIKPSSEKGIHASAYLLHQNISFVIHTHQHYASVICAEENDVTDEDGTHIVCASYGLPGTKKLRTAVEKSMKENIESKVFLLAKHGALLLGEDYEETFSLAKKLENSCKTIFDKRSEKFTEENNLYEKYLKSSWLDDHAQIIGNNSIEKIISGGEDEEAVRLIASKNSDAAKYISEGKLLGISNAKPIGFFDSALQRAVYKLKYSKRKDA